ncbi:hypothetical protein KQ939_00455 [Planococcus sp. CP5-4]|uniref:hypothetical protein n=1 Tax=Planococcus TaxID=1372 RepID=UPI001B8CB05F|nr:MULTISPECIES: hypothetical protein [unclassified Planococcus (in: firmicutes)]MBU9673337.1 hypothetical protein [Planococcus sp. CP5-4_YE]MBV0908110.1 hypothetical protein [Planococcus sp. CP5-4_UN]MBW6062171.1 hypothetical protein [Planococcus sp. CP5-4]
MEVNRKTAILLFGSGVASTLLVLPLLYALGLPSFEVVLISLFGEGNIWALVFTVVLILLILFSLRKSFKSPE